MTDKAFFDSARFDYTRFDVYLPHFDQVTQKLESLTRGQGGIPPSTFATYKLGQSRLGVTIPMFEALKKRLERLG